MHLTLIHNCGGARSPRSPAAEKISAYVSLVLPADVLAPEIVEAILDGRELMDFREVLARWNVVGTADQGGEEAVQHLKVHRPLVPKVFEYVGKPIELCVGQGLSIHGLLVAVLIALKHPMRRKLFCGPVD
jgi:hypothetical protein